MSTRLAKLAVMAKYMDEKELYAEADAISSILWREAQNVMSDEEADEVSEAEVKPYKLNMIHPGRDLKPEDPWYHQVEDPSKHRLLDPRDKEYQHTMQQVYKDRPYGDGSRPNAHQWIQKNVLPSYYVGGDVNGELLPHDKLPKPQHFGNYIIPVAPGQGHLTARDRARFVAHDEDLDNQKQNVNDVFNKATRFDPETGRGKTSAHFDVTSFGSEGKPVQPQRLLYDQYLDKAGAYDALKARGSLPFSNTSQYDAVRLHQPELLEPRARKAYDAIDWDNPDPEKVKALLTHVSRGYGHEGIVNIERAKNPESGRHPYMNRKLLRSHFPNI